MHTDRAVVVTGGAQGIGLGISQLFARNGHPVAILDLDEAALKKETDALSAEGARVMGRKVDVRSRNEIEAAYADIRKEFGPISIVVANAGIAMSATFVDMSIDVWQRMIDVNLTGMFHTIQAAVPDMLEAKWGRIITISSHAALSGAPDRAHYSAAKGGVIGLTRALAREFGSQGITVNTIPPSLVETPACHRDIETGLFPPLEVITPQIPIPRVGSPNDIARGCEYLASEGAEYVTGVVLPVNGGMFIG